MKQYIVDFLKSRKKDKSDFIKCEFGDCRQRAVDVHHIRCSYRSKRQHYADWSDLIALCREHHEFVHANNDTDMRSGLTYIVKLILQQIKNTTA